MTYAEIIAAAARLGIRETRAPVGSEVWQCWADRVRQAESHEFQAFMNDTASGCSAHEKYLAEAIEEANRYAV